MRITKFGHSCFLIEDSGARILFDPGVFSSGFEDLDQLDAILITHQHPDHYVAGNIRGLLDKSAKARVFADEGSAMLMHKAGIDAKAVRAGDRFEVAGLPVAVYGKSHETIHPDIPVIPDAGFFVAERFFYPGDAYTVPGVPVELLATPAAAPWLKIADAIDYLRSMKPKVAFPAHDAVLSEHGHALHNALLSSMGGAGEYRVLAHGVATEF